MLAPLRAPSPEWARTGRGYRFIYLWGRHLINGATPLHVRGTEHFPMEGPLIVASNHYTWADPVFLAGITPRPYHFLAKAELFKPGFPQWFFSSNNCIPVHRKGGSRNEGAIDASRGVLERGGCIAIYPEGARAPPGTLLPGKTGAVRLAFETGAPIVPVGTATDRFWPKGEAMPRLGVGAWLQVGEPIRLGRNPDLADDRARCEKETEALMARIASLLAGAVRARDRGEEWGWRVPDLVRVTRNGRAPPADRRD